MLILDAQAVQSDWQEAMQTAAKDVPSKDAVPAPDPDLEPEPSRVPAMLTQPPELALRERLLFALGDRSKYPDGLYPNEQEKAKAAGSARKEVGPGRFESQKSDGGTLKVSQHRSATDVLEGLKLGMEPVDLAETMFASLPGDVSVNINVPTWADRDDTPALMVRAEGKGMEVTRIIHREKDDPWALVADHTLFKLDRAAQGTGVAKDLLRDSVALYQKLGVDRVELQANLDVGGYAWAKFGFTAVNPKGMAEDLREHIPKVAGLTPPQKTILLDLVDKYANDPQLPWHIAGATAGSMKFGKTALLGANWVGELKLKDADSMGRFKRYTAQK